MSTRPAFNQRNPGVKRIMQEMKELSADPSEDFIAEALESDIFEWHFVVRGPSDSEFEGGIYHGRILLPPDYPFKPPAFMMLSGSGRFETGMKICLSISSHHPEHWQPSWSVRTALTAMIAFMPSPGNGALGSLDFTKDERRALALASRTAAPRFGSAERQKVCDEMHARMLVLEKQPRGGSSKAAAAAAAAAASASPSTGAAAPAAAAAAWTAPPTTSEPASPPAASSPEAAAADGPASTSAAAAPAVAPLQPAGTVPVLSSTPPPALPRPPAAAAAADAGAYLPATGAVVAPAAGVMAPLLVEAQSERGLTLLAYGLVFAILAILAKKCYFAMGLELPALD